MLNEKRIFIRGASDGLGRELAYLLAHTAACRLAICGRSETKLKETLRTIYEINPDMEVFAACFDATKEEDCHQFAQNVKERFGGIDILVNNAGANIQKDKVENIDIAQLKYMFDLNCAAPLIFIQEFLPGMKERQDGHIINVLSSVCLHSIENSGAYSASKHAMNILHKILTKEVREDNIRVSGIYPGGIDTNFRENKRPDYLHPASVAKAILDVMNTEDGVIHELVMRPMSENNF